VNRWQTFWRSLDEARFIVRAMLIAKFVALVVYVFSATRSFHGVIVDALAQGQAADWAQLVPVLTAVTAFYGVTIPVLSNMYLKAWHDYRQSGTDWDAVAAGQFSTRDGS
jgi:hypothetical protein